MRADTDWFLRAGYGVFVHYLHGLQNNPDHLASLGRQTDWDTCVREFDTEQFAETMAEAGAGYVIFTVMQVQRFMIAPNATFDWISGYAPGEACAQRDLIEDLYQSLSRRGIPLLLYYTGDGPRGDAQAGARFGWTEPVNREFVTRWAEVAREYGERYGDKVVGYWVDGCYPFIGYNDELLGILADGLKAGNPNRIIALNRGVDPVVMSYTRHDDYTTGEQNQFHDMPVERFLDGEQWHILSYLGQWWGGSGSKYQKRELAEYVYDVHQRGGVVSIDVLLYRDGTIDRSQLEMLKAVRQELDHGAERPPIPPGNLAYRKPARLLSLDGGHELVPSGGSQTARQGVDGQQGTTAQGANEWPWTFHVDLLNTVDVRRVKVVFGSGFPTQWQVLLSADGATWTTIGESDAGDGAPLELACAPTRARYVRVRSLKPDGPNQPGAQMAVAELEVYE